MAFSEKFARFHDKNYKKLLLIPAALLVLSLVFLGYFYFAEGDFIRKDISLTGGTSITVFSDQPVNLEELRSFLSNKIDDFAVRELSDFRSGKQKAVIIESPSDASELRNLLEEYLGFELDSENSSIESTGSSLGQGFYLQLVYAIVLSFSFMAIVVFFIFGGSTRLKLLMILITFIPVILFFSKVYPIEIAIIVNALILLGSVILYFKKSVPSAAVVLSAFADIIMTLAVVDLLGIKVSSAGIIAFLMLIGYSVDSDIMLTTRLLKRHGSENRLLNAFKTGITMTVTSIVAITAALVITQGFSEVLKQIFIVLLIGLIFDILNTWITNTSILKWYLESRSK
jgi:preprotein translocase subunit SecF